MSHTGFSELVRLFGKIGLLSFGGPAGQIALMHRELVEERRWVEEGPFLRALNVCHLLPGPEAQQLATWIGWRLHGTKGGLAAGLLFVLPGAAVMLGLSILYAYAADLKPVAALFLGIKAAVLAIVTQALIRIGRRALDTGFKRALALTAFLALFLFALPFPIVVLGAAALGFLLARFKPTWLKAHGVAAGSASSGPLPWGQTVRTILLWLLIWAAPMAAILLLLGPDHVLWKIGAFFSQLAIVTFGGAYAVLAYMAQEAVQSMHWLSAGEMTDGLGLAETTPGPLILVTQFVGFLGAFRAPAPFPPLVAGMLGAIVTLWVTFSPCFLWIFAMAPWMERLEHAPRLQGALAALTAAIVGVIANLTLWFALHVLFTRQQQVEAGGLHLLLPDPASLDWRIALIAIGAGVMIFRLKQGVMTTLAVAALAGLALTYLGG
ncbi:chromate efflux transporter [Sphingobium sp. BYY-5]|uniref:chromate efflux transporter n=1 Tax=Sphingobium sp. BYY-5 TaxID=2926400 RepID=UPI001FA75686|nr:chromate efflux transporter [Sphingobium sp. BYY-5]MCI4589680.1 chromate efflux transporter [Sphingobium sp. BYY-5]